MDFHPRRTETKPGFVSAAGFVLVAIAASAWAVLSPDVLMRAQGRAAVAQRDGTGRTSAAPVAVVNGTPIDEDELGVRLAQLLPLASYHGNVAPDRLLALRRAALDELVLDELIYREAVAGGRRAARAAVDVELEVVRARFDNEAQFAAALAENGLDESAFRERLARTVIVRDARADRARQAITEEDIATYYRANERMFERPERVHLLEILVRRDPADPASSVSARRKARAILGRLQRGEPFDPIARASSEDEYRVKDGDMGFVHRGRLDAAFEPAVFAAPIGRYEMAESLYGFEVFKVVERRSAEQLTLQEARPIIAERLERLRRDEALCAWHARLLVGARIVIADPALRATRPAQIPIDRAATLSRLRPIAGAGGHP